jgi:type II secretory pathway component PulK
MNFSGYNTPSASPARRGSAVLVVLVLVAVLAALAVANTEALREFKDEILRLEAGHQQLHGQGAGH